MAHDSKDATSVLVNSCIKVLKTNEAGMTTKEMAAASENEKTEGFDGISSSISSSKLNAVFRRCQNMSKEAGVEKLAELPLSRAQSNELPRRLVYRYNETLNADNHVTESKNNDIRKMMEESDTAKESEIRAKHIHTRRRSDHNLDSSSEESDTSEARAPSTPKEDEIDHSTWPAAKRQRRESSKDQETVRHIADIPRSSTPPNTYELESSSFGKAVKTTSGLGLSHKLPAQKLPSCPTPKFNLYYDIVGFEAVSAALDCGDMTKASLSSPESKPAEDLEHTFEFISPETFGLNDLDHSIG